MNTSNPYAMELEMLGSAVQSCSKFPIEQLRAERGPVLNPSLEMVPSKWTGLCRCLENGEAVPEPKDAMVIVWKDPTTGATRCKDAGADDLLALKIIGESIDVHGAALEGGVSVGLIEAFIQKAVEEGLVLKAPALISRDESFRSKALALGDDFYTADIFTLQWHVTQACDLHCRHCYDRSERSYLEFEKALAILDDFQVFCEQNGVRGQVTFTGGNPILYPRFRELYRAAAERGFLIAILGNPTSANILDEIIEMRMPEFFQVSLEGLQAHNDAIRGAGHYQRVLEFLKILKDRGVYSMVMLTLTKENANDVLPLAELLRDKVDLFTFNRLTLFGEGAALNPVPVKEFETFLDRYRQAAANNPAMSLKDNLFNRSQHVKGLEPFGGCAGFGCGAAFNFVSLLPDGEVHACRKFPSYIGNAFKQSLQDIYYCREAVQYRKGSEACSGCSIRAVCRGCPAVVAGHGMDPFTERDPYCEGRLDE